MNYTRYFKNIFITILLIIIPTRNHAMLKHTVQQLKIVKSFFPNIKTIQTIRNVMDRIEDNKLDYDDYAKRRGFIWTDALVKTSKPSEIIETYKTRKVTLVDNALEVQRPQTILDYPVLLSILNNEILPKMFEEISTWHDIPQTAYVQIFFQRCHSSETMEWHQDPGEDYDPQADYSMVLMLSDQDDPIKGWNGGEFKIRPGFPEDKYNEDDVQTIIHKCNQAVIWNNQINSHSAMEVIPNTVNSKRDIIVILVSFNKMPKKI